MERVALHRCRVKAVLGALGRSMAAVIVKRAPSEAGVVYLPLDTDRWVRSHSVSRDIAARSAR